jgi:hypothetical protein
MPAAETAHFLLRLANRPGRASLFPALQKALSNMAYKMHKYNRLLKKGGVFMMDLSILVFFQRWLIEKDKELKHYRHERISEGDLHRHPPDTRFE